MTDGTTNPWRPLLHQRMRGQPTPMLVMPDAIWSAASLWAGTRAWVAAFRASGLTAGDRLVCALPEGPAFVQVLLACLWDEITFTPIDPRADVDAAVRAVGARGMVTDDARAWADGCGHFVPDAASQPPNHSVALRAAPQSPLPSAAVVVSSDSTGEGPPWSGYSTHALFAALESYASPGSLAGARVLSVLPWCNAPGMIAGLLLPLLEADEIVRERSAGANRGAIEAAVLEHGITHVDAELSRHSGA